MSQQQQSVVKEVKLGSSDKFQTIISLKDVQSPLGNVELRNHNISIADSIVNTKSL